VVNKEVSYKQGMNEIIAVLLTSIYPYYGLRQNLQYKELIDLIENSENLNDNLLKEVLCFITDENELEADLFNLFDSFMKRGVKDIYYVPDVDLLVGKDTSLTKVKYFN
jgi:hypothetical protein